MTEADTDVDALIEPAALDLMAIRLTTPLQVAEHLDRAFEAGFRTGQKPVTAEIVATALAPDLDDLEPRLTRQGYSVKVLADQFHAKPSEIRRFLGDQLDAGRTRELATGCVLSAWPCGVRRRFARPRFQSMWAHSLKLWAGTERWSQIIWVQNGDNLRSDAG